MMQKKIMLAGLVLFQLLFFNHHATSMEDGEETETSEEIKTNENETTDEAETTDEEKTEKPDKADETDETDEASDVQTKQFGTIELEKEQPITTSENPKVMKIFEQAKSLTEESDDEIEKMEISRKNFHDIFTRLNNELDELFLRANIKRGQSKATPNNKK